MSVVANLSPEYDFVRFRMQSLDARGSISYDLYHRFPILGYLLIKLAVSPFSDDFSAQFHAARVLMLSFFVATAVLAYLSLCRLVSDEWIALAATLLSFSSFYLLYYNDMIATEGVIDLFGVMLVFHGMVVFIQDGRFRQLLAKTCTALLLGWHVFALLFPFVIFISGREIFHYIHARNGSGKRLVLSLLRSRSLTLGAVSLLFGTSVLAFNFIMEYIALNGETPLTQLPSWKAMLYRTGLNSHGLLHLHSWSPFLEQQFSQIGGMVYPYYLLQQVFDVQNHWSMPDLFVLGIIASVTCLIGLVFSHHKILLASLLASGFCWALPMHQTAALHNFESMFYIGIPLIFFTFCALGFLWICKLFDNRIVVVFSRFFSTICSVFVFVFSTLYMSQVGYGVEERRFHEKLSDDFNAVRKIMKSGIVLVRRKFHEDLHSHGTMLDPDIVQFIIPYYLAGNVILDERERDFWDRADFMLKSKHERMSKALLTPENEFVFLYDKAIYDNEQEYLKKYSAVTATDDPDIHSKFDVYYLYNENKLIYIKEPCSLEDLSGEFYISISDSSKNAPDSPSGENHPKESIFFRFQDNGIKYGDKCIAEVALPESSIDPEGIVNYVRTGQYDDSNHVWYDGFDARTGLYKSEYLPVLDQDPVTRSIFDLYINGNMLYYVKDPCSLDDTISRFFVNVYPVNVHDLPEGRHDFETISFDFEKTGMRVDGRCIMRTMLPSYFISHVQTGQQAKNGSILWSAIYYFNVNDKHGILLASHEPEISSTFDVYHYKNTLVYIKEPCTPFDTKDRFFLHLLPLEKADLPPRRKRYGFDNLDFRFPTNINFNRFGHFSSIGGEYFDKKCLASVMLPEYEIASIRTGQSTTHVDENGDRRHIQEWRGEFLIRHQ